MQLAQNINLKNMCHSYGGGQGGGGGGAGLLLGSVGIVLLDWCRKSISMICFKYFFYILDEADTVGFALA